MIKIAYKYPIYGIEFFQFFSNCQTQEKHQIRFKTIDISKDKKAKADCERHGCRGVPVVLVGSRWICGFDKSKINRELGIREG